MLQGILAELQGTNSSVYICVTVDLQMLIWIIRGIYAWSTSHQLSHLIILVKYQCEYSVYFFFYFYFSEKEFIFPSESLPSSFTFFCYFEKLTTKFLTHEQENRSKNCNKTNVKQMFC